MIYLKNKRPIGENETKRIFIHLSKFGPYGSIGTKKAFSSAIVATPTFIPV